MMTFGDFIVDIVCPSLGVILANCLFAGKSNKLLLVCHNINQ